MYSDTINQFFFFRAFCFRIIIQNTNVLHVFFLFFLLTEAALGIISILLASELTLLSTTETEKRISKQTS